MAEPSTDGSNLPMLGGSSDPAQYERQAAKERFAVAKFYGMGSDGEWTAEEVADALNCSKRQVFRYIHESDIGEDVREMLAVTEAEWRLDTALKLRREVERLEQIEEELLNRKKSVATAFETKTVEGTPTGDRNIRLPDDSDTYSLKMPVPTDFDTVTDYGADLEKVQKEKRQYLAQISDLLGLNEADQRGVDEALANGHSEVKIVEFRESDDPYPEAEAVDTTDEDAAEQAADVIDIDADVNDPAEDGGE